MSACGALCGDFSDPVPVPLPEDFPLGMAGVQCKCGRFLKHAYPVVTLRGSGYWRAEGITDVRGICWRCGPDVPAGPGWWHSWEAWFE